MGKHEPIRVLLLFTIMNRGGAETMIMNYYRRLDRTKIQFDFMVHRQERGAYDDEIESLGGKIYRMIPIYPQNFMRYKKMLRDFFAEHKEYRIIHSHMSELGYLAFKEAKKAGVPHRICHAHNAPDFSREGFFEWMKLPLRLKFIYGIRKYTNHYFVCSHIAGLWLYGKKNSEHFVFMKNAIDTNRFAYQKEKSLSLKKQFHLDGKFVICHIGRFNQQKNHSFLIDIFEEIKKEYPNSTLLLVGEGRLKKVIEQKVELKGLSSDVFFLGPRNDVPDILQLSDVLLFPSIYEGLSVVLVEAQTSGIKCVITDSLAEETIICPNNVTQMSLKSSAKKWAEKVLALRGYERVDVSSLVKEQGWDITSTVQSLEDFYLSLKIV